MRPPALRSTRARELLTIYQKATRFYKAQKTCNQFYIAEKIQQDFVKSNDWENISSLFKDSEIRRLAEKYDLPENSIYELTYYICRTSPAAIVQMCKRIRKQVQN